MNRVKNRYLEHMGIKVFVPRKQRSDNNASTANTVSLQSPGPGKVENNSPVKSAEPEGSVIDLVFADLVFAEYDNFLLIYQKPPEEQIGAAYCKRFCDGLIFSMDKKAVLGKTIMLKYLPLKSTDCDQIGKPKESPALDHFKSLGGNFSKLVLFGHHPASLIYPPDTSSSVIYKQDTVEERSVLAVEELGSYFAQPLKKRELWQALGKF